MLRSRVVLFLLLTLATSGLVSAARATDVSGTITTTKWTKANSPYRVVGAIAVPPGNTLTIEPGVDVLFDSTAQILVSGRLVAIGTETDSIRFLMGTTDWRGIRISGGDSSTLAYVRISGSISTVFSGPNGAGIGITGANTRLGISHSVISGNQNGMSGGGIAVGDSARLTMRRCAIRDNYCYYAGGGIYNKGDAALSECLISGNVPSGLFYGGGIYNTGTLAAKGCTITANRAGNGGAGIYNESGGTVEIDSSVISSNRAGIAGGGFGNYGTMRVTRCLVINNLANADWPEGAGGRNGGSLYAANCTFYGNSGGSGNGITHSGGTTELVNTIIWGNAAPQLKGFDQPGVTVTYSNIEQDAGLFPGTGNINADPQFTDAANQDLRLWPGSPCIDTGDPTSPLDPDGSRADMGARPFDPTLTVESPQMPPRFLVMQNAPNPFNPSTVIRFALPEAAHVKLVVYTVTGQKAAVLRDGFMPAGYHEIRWDAAGFPSGTYFYTCRAGKNEKTRRMLLLK